ncbi:MAG: hypothetical protein CFE40_11570 [Burkholderiales bacterium PBB1]|nr:MAG: hypothetical protein CFE40_11570 [Burkholderiales bacterium PBB1]
MKTQVFLGFLSYSALLLGSDAIFAQSFRCKADLVSLGDSRASVAQKCGQPVSKDSFCKPPNPQVTQNQVQGSTVVNVIPCTNVDEWTYNPGYGQFMTTLLFEEGILRAIRYGERVK